MEMNPYNLNCGGNVGIAGQMLGETYRVVRCVYDNMDIIQTVFHNLSNIKQAANSVHRQIVELQGMTGALGTEAAITLPEAVADNSIMDFTAMIRGTDDALYTAAEGYFTIRIYERSLIVTLVEDAPVVLANADILATVTYKD